MKKPQHYSVIVSKASQAPRNVSHRVLVHLSTGARDLWCIKKQKGVEAPHHPPACLKVLNQKHPRLHPFFQRQAKLKEILAYCRKAM